MEDYVYFCCHAVFVQWVPSNTVQEHVSEYVSQQGPNWIMFAMLSFLQKGKFTSVCNLERFLEKINFPPSAEFSL